MMLHSQLILLVYDINGLMLSARFSCGFFVFGVWNLTYIADLLTLWVCCALRVYNLFFRRNAVISLSSPFFAQAVSNKSWFALILQQRQHTHTQTTTTVIIYHRHFSHTDSCITLRCHFFFSVWHRLFRIFGISPCFLFLVIRACCCSVCSIQMFVGIGSSVFNSKRQFFIIFAIMCLLRLLVSWMDH